MEYNIENLHKICRICLRQNGEFYLQRNSFELENLVDNESIDGNTVTIKELLNIFNNIEEDFLELIDELPLICGKCLNDFKFCYTFYTTMKQRRIEMKQLYEDCLNNIIQYSEEEGILDKEEENYEEELLKNIIEEVQEEHESAFNVENTINGFLISSTNEEEIVTYMEINDQQESPLYDKSEFNGHSTMNGSLKLSTIEEEIGTYMETNDQLELSSNDILYSKVRLKSNTDIRSINNNFSMVVPKFLPAIFNGHSEKYPDSKASNCKLMTIECQLVEVTDINQLTNDEFFLEAEDDNPVENDDIMYICKCCPEAFTKFSYLKNHFQRTHICKYCTQSFNLTTDLFKHVREVHTEHKCIICNRKLSSHSNLRSHIKRVHRINLPSEVILLDVIEKPILHKNESTYLDYSATSFDDFQHNDYIEEDA